MFLRVSRPPLLIMASAASLCVVVITPLIHGTEPAEAGSLTTTAKLPPFDVISIKPNNSAEHRAMVEFVPDGIHVVNISPVFLLREAFDVNDDQIINLPSWARSASYDIDAKVAPDDVPAVKNLAREQRAQMMLSIFTDRFHLAYHHETRTLPQYLLVSARGGPKLEEVKPGESGKPGSGYMSAGATKMVATGVDIPMLARMLSQRVGHPVVDKTGLTGKYSFRLQWAPEPHEGAPSHDPGPDGVSAAGDSGPSIFTAIQEQLGLKLESEKGPVDVIVIDHIEQPAAN